MQRSNNHFAREGGGATCETSIAALRVRDLGSRQMTPLRGSTENAFLFSQFGQTCPIADPVEYEQADR